MKNDQTTTTIIVTRPTTSNLNINSKSIRKHLKNNKFKINKYSCDIMLYFVFEFANLIKVLT